jgi:hypothetical protein
LTRQTFSRAFIVSSSAAPNWDFEVPPGYTAVIRQCTYYELAGVGVCNVIIQDSASAPQVTVCTLRQTGSAQLLAFDCRIVVPAGGFISIFPASLGTGPQVYVGGYLLADSSTSPPLP